MHQCNSEVMGACARGIYPTTQVHEDADASRLLLLLFRSHLLLQGLDRTLGIALLPNADNGVADKDDQDDEGLDKRGELLFLVLFQKGKSL